MHYCSSFLLFEDEVKTISGNVMQQIHKYFLEHFSYRVWLCFRKRTRRHYLIKLENSSLVCARCEFLVASHKTEEMFFFSQCFEVI